MALVRVIGRPPNCGQAVILLPEQICLAIAVHIPGRFQLPVALVAQRTQLLQDIEIVEHPHADIPHRILRIELQRQHKVRGQVGARISHHDGAGAVHIAIAPFREAPAETRLGHNSRGLAHRMDAAAAHAATGSGVGL